MASVPIADRHKMDFHRRAPIKEAVRAATTANITISTALNNGDTLDGLTLATGDRVLVKDQSTGSQNGIYVVGTSPARDYDESTEDPSFGYLVFVIAGTTNGGTLWKNTNTSAPTIGSTSLTFSQVAATGLTDPMTTRGDIIVRNASNVTARLAIGAAGKILSSDGMDVSWGNGPMTTQDDLIVGGASGAPTRLAKGSDSQVLTVDPTTHHLVWATPSSGFSNPMTTKGDLIVGDTGGSAIRKGVGSDGDVLTADSASTGGVKWAAGGGGSSDAILGQSGIGGARISGLQGSPDIDVAATNDDEFNTTDTSDPMTGWTTVGSPTHDINSTAKSHYRVIVPTSGGVNWGGIYKTPPSTPYTVTCKLTDGRGVSAFNSASLFIAESPPGKMEAIAFGAPDSAGPGRLGVFNYTSPTSFNSTISGPATGLGGPPIYLRIIVTSGTSVAYYWSFNGLSWVTMTTGRNPGFTIGAVGLAVQSNNGSVQGEAFFDWIRFT